MAANEIAAASPIKPTARKVMPIIMTSALAA
jgi:hypothetical protein